MASQTQSLMSAQNKTIAISVTSTSSTSVSLPSSGSTLRVFNGGSKNAFFCISTAGTAATVPAGTAVATGTPIGAGVDATFSIPNTANTSEAADGTFSASTPLKITAICGGTDTTTLYVQVGEGM